MYTPCLTFDKVIPSHSYEGVNHGRLFVLHCDFHRTEMGQIHGYDMKVGIAITLTRHDSYGFGHRPGARALIL